MKRFYNIIFVALASYSFGGCTLMMDDLDKEEGNVNLEEVGFNEPYTEKTEFGDIAFQYGDSTQVLRQKALDYLLDVVGDSVLYFSDNIPKDLLVPEGMYVSMGCNEKLRHGLCSKVLSLTKADGMYRMETTRVSQTDVYKQFDVDLYLDYDQQMCFDPEDYLEEQEVSYAEDDTVIVFTDWALFGQDVVERKEAEIRRKIQATRAITRADDDDEQGEEGNANYNPKDEDLNPGKTTTKDTRIVTINVNKLKAWSGPFNQMVKEGLDISVVLSHHEKTTVRFIQKVSNGQNYQKQIYDEEDSLHLKIRAGWKESLGKKENIGAIWSSIYKGKNWAHDASRKAFMVHLPVPAAAGAIELFLRFTPKFSVDLSILGDIEVGFGLGKTHKEVEYKDQKLIEKKHDVDDEENSGFKLKKWDIYGEFKVKGGVEFLAGAASGGGSFGLGIGAEVGATFTLKASAKTAISNFLNGINPRATFATFEVYLEPKIKAFAQDPKGNEWGSLDFNIPGCPKHISLIGPETWYYWPTVGEPKGYFTTSVEEGKTVADVRASYEFTDLSLAGMINAIDKTPAMHFYRVEQNGKKTTLEPQIADGKSVKKGVKYEFAVKDYGYKEGCSYQVMPFLYAYTLHNVYYEQNLFKCPKEDGSEIQYADLFQNNYELYEDDKGYDREKWIFIVQAYISDISKIHNWKDWGVKLSIYELDDKIANYRLAETSDGKNYENIKFSLKKKTIKKNTVSVKFNIDDYAGKQYRVRAYLYYKDEDDFEHTITHPVYMTDEEEDDPLGELIAKGMINLTNNMEEWGKGSVGQSQVLDMEGL